MLFPSKKTWMMVKKKKKKNMQVIKILTYNNYKECYGNNGEQYILLLYMVCVCV